LKPIGSSTGRSSDREAISMRARTLRRDLRAMMADGVGFGLMVGSGESYLAAFALALGLSAHIAGLVAAVPLLAGAVLQLVSPLGVRWLRSYRRWVVVCAAAQSLSFAPLVLAALLGHVPGWGLIAIASLYWAAGMATGPAWNTWVGELVPRFIRARYFASRARYCQASILIGLVGIGALLHATSERGVPLLGFALAFGLAAVSRAISATNLSRQSEPRGLADSLQQLDVETLSGALRGGPGRLLAYMLAVQTMVHIAGPYFTPYMLRELALSYLSYTILIAVSFVGKIVAAPFLGELAQRLGTRRLLWIGGSAVVPLAALWCVADSFWYLLILQVVAGAAWAAYELATFLLFFDAIPAASRTRLLTLFNLANALALVAGACIGALLLSGLGADRYAYFTVFLVSSVGRIATLILLRRVSDAPVPATFPALRTLAARPSAGSIDRPVLATIEAENPDREPAAEEA
jgi:MFS family permease